MRTGGSSIAISLGVTGTVVAAARTNFRKGAGAPLDRRLPPGWLSPGDRLIVVLVCMEQGATGPAGHSPAAARWAKSRGLRGRGRRRR